MWIPYAFWPTLTAVIINLFLLIYIIRADIRKAGNMPAFIMFLSLFIWSLGELLERIAGPPPHDEMLAFFGARFLFIGIAIIPASLIHFIIEYPYRIKINKNIKAVIVWTLYGISLAAIILDFIDDIIGHVIIAGESSYSGLGQKIWGLDPGVGYKIYISLLVIVGLIVMVALPLKLRNVKMKIVRKQIWITFSGMLTTVILVLVTGYFPILLNIQMYPLTTVSFSIFGLFIIYSIYRYRLFLVVPAAEEVKKQEELPEAGFYQMDREEAYQKFANLAKSGYKSLGFINGNPENFKERYGLVATPIFGIAEEPGKDILNPEIEEQREMIPFIIATFLEDVEEGVVLVDLSAEHLSENTRRKIIEDIKRESGGRGVFLVVPS